MEDRAVVLAGPRHLHEVRDMVRREIRPQIDDEDASRRVNDRLLVRHLQRLTGPPRRPAQGCWVVSPVSNVASSSKGMSRMVRSPPCARTISVLALTLVLAALPQAQSEKLDYTTIGRIRDEGLNRSQVMDHIGWLSDVYGPRLTGGPGIKQASEWTMKKLTEWGLANPTPRDVGRSARAGRSCASTRT